MPNPPPPPPSRAAPAGGAPTRPGGAGPSRWRALLAAAALVVLGAAVLAPALGGGWLWDDNNEVTENRILRDPAGLARIWLAPAGPDYFPLKSSWQWLEWRLWGARPAGYHAASLALHLASALLVWRLLRRLGVRWAWLGALLFAIHPLTVESVAWAAELKNTLSLPLLLGAMLAYLAFDDRRARAAHGRAGPYLLALVLFVLAMLAKSSVVMLPAVLLLHAWWRRGRLGAADAAATAPFFAVSLALGAVTLHFQQQVAIGGWTIDAGGPALRVARAGVALAFYLGKCILPTGLSPLYPSWSFPALSPVVALSWIALAALAAACWRWRRTWGRHAILGLGFFALNLLPVIGLVTISYNHYSWVADHFAYLSIIGLVGLASAGAGAFAQGGPAGRGIAAGAAVLVAVLFAADSHRYARVFHSSDTLWRRALERDPASWAAHYNLGYADAQAGRLADGVSQYEAALRIRPDFAEAQNTLGIALAQEGRLPEAIAHLRAAVRLDAAYAEAHANLGLALAITGRLPEAVAEYGLALRLNPADTKARIKLGLALLQENRPAEAIPCFEEVLRLDPGAAGVPAYLDYARRQAGK